MRKWLCMLLAVLICSMAPLAGCGKKEAGSGKGLKILFTINKMDTFRGMLAEAAENAAKEHGAQVTVMDAGGDIEVQVSQVRQAVKDQYDLIICSLVSAETALEVAASAGELPIVFVNSRPDDPQLKAGRYMFVGSDEKMAGQYQAEYILDKLSDRQEINVMLLKGPDGHSATAGRSAGLKRAFAASGKQIRYVFEDHADWDGDRAMRMFDIFMRTGSELDCIVCNNDAMALGAVEACRKAGMDSGRIMILGVDATADGCAAIKNGEMAFTVYQSAKGQGTAAVEAALKLAAGDSVKDMEGASEDGKYVWVQFEKVDSSNVSQYE